MKEKNKLVSFNATKEIYLLIALMLVCWTANFIADAFLGTWLFRIFYHGVFAILCCITIPLYIFLIRKNLPAQSIGLNTKNKKGAVIIGLIIAIVTCIGRMFSLVIPDIPVSQIIYIIVAMLFSTLFEEIFFRGVLLSRFEKQFGVVFAIILSSLCFSLYHSAQSFISFDVESLLTLFFVGILFGASYKVTNSVITAYIVNLPHAVLTFLGDTKYLNYSLIHMNITSTITTAIATAIALAIIIAIQKIASSNG